MQLAELLQTTELQPLFDAAVRGVLRQGKTCSHYQERSSGMRCAVGHCMTPAGLDYISRTCRNADPVARLWNPRDMLACKPPWAQLLVDLQIVNDGSHSLEEMTQGFRDTAAKYKLSAAVVEEKA